MQARIGIKFAGGFKALDGFADKVAKVPESLKTVSEQLAEETLELIAEGFEKQRDPYGKKWKEHSDLTKLLRPGGRILEGKTGNLKSSWHRKRADGQGFAVGNAKSYAIFHQDGTGIYGKSGKRIKPKSAKALRVKGPDGPIFLGSVAGSPKRRMVPDGRLPKAWANRFVETATDVLTELFR